MVLKGCAGAEGRAEAGCKSSRNSSFSLCSDVIPVLRMGPEMLLQVSAVLCSQWPEYSNRFPL